ITFNATKSFLPALRSFIGDSPWNGFRACRLERMMRGDLSTLVVMNRGGGERGPVGPGPRPCFKTALHVEIATCAPRLDGSAREVGPRVRYLILGRLVGDVHDIERTGTEFGVELMRRGNRRHGHFGV